MHLNGNALALETYSSELYGSRLVIGFYGVCSVPCIVRIQNKMFWRDTTHIRRFKFVLQFLCRQSLTSHSGAMCDPMHLPSPNSTLTEELRHLSGVFQHFNLIAAALFGLKSTYLIFYIVYSNRLQYRMQSNYSRYLNSLFTNIMGTSVAYSISRLLLRHNTPQVRVALSH